MTPEEREYLEFLERCVVSDGRGALVALFFFIIATVALAGLAWARFQGAVPDDEWVPQILSYQ